MTDLSPVEVLDQTYEMVALGKLSLHPQNPNQGDVGAISESLAHHGFYGAVIAQKSTGHILAGNHRVLAAKEMGVREVPVIWVDVDDEQAARILLVDNRTTRLGKDDETVLTELLQALAMTEDVLHGTGYDGDDLDKLLADANKPLKIPENRVVVEVEVDDKEAGDQLVEQLAGLGYQSKVQVK